ncbi:MAG: spore germination protein [Desulfitobacteriaceae bacterium]|nr:spore germination protein [Desulfitobacteriaceae bacterium]MDD4345385.1 spore germination protein [Desulfitobacteriaceae bacterium]MDD4401502.1 spore germination protein [Desulfitobacteriaceae bacterium]
MIKIHKAVSRRKRQTPNRESRQGSDNIQGTENNLGTKDISARLSKDLEKNESVFQQALGNSPDVIFRYLSIGKQKVRAVLIFISGLADTASIAENILKSLTYEIRCEDLNGAEQLNLALIKENILSNAEIAEENSFEQLLKHILLGDTVLLIDSLEIAIVIFARSSQGFRAVGEPVSEALIRGPREGFIEKLQINRSMIRRKLRSPKLKFQELTIGEISQTQVCISYLDGIADKQLVSEVLERLSRIKIDGILESGYIEELIQDAPYSPFPTVRTTERPDTVAACLLEGKVAILVDGTPYVIVVPGTFIEFLQVNEDYYQSYIFVLGIRILRYLSFFITLFLPSMYVAILTFHQEMLPSTLALSLSATRQGIPFPAFVEALIMEVAFEILREAGLRLPRPVGQSVSIVGALVIGDAAVKAGLVSPAMVIIVATTAIASFTIPGFSLGLAIRLLRFPIMILSASLGLYGLIVAGFALFVHMSTLRSFGVPYLAPIAPANWPGQKDVFLRAPWWAMTTRPLDTGHQDFMREKTDLKPQKPKE